MNGSRREANHASLRALGSAGGSDCPLVSSPDPSRQAWATGARPALIVHGILGILHTGAPWRDRPERYGPGKTVFPRFNSGARTAPGFGLSPRCGTNGTTRASSIPTWGGSMALSSGRAELPPGRKNKASSPRRLGGRRRRNSRSHLTLRSGVRVVAWARRSPGL